MPEDTIHDEMLRDMSAMRLALGRQMVLPCCASRKYFLIRKTGLLPKADMAAPGSWQSILEERRLR
jgi:hypothetical protein